MTMLIRPSTRFLECARRMVTSVAVKRDVSEKKERSNQFDQTMLKSYEFVNVLENEDYLINKLTKKNEKIQDSEWALIRKDLLDNAQCTEVTVDSKISNICLYRYKLEEALSYLKFLRRNNYKMNINILGTYLKLYHVRRKPLTNEEEEEILQVYDSIRKQYPVLDSKTATECLLGLSLTKRWKDAIELIDIIKITAKVGHSCVAALVCAALRSNEVEVAWELLNNRGSEPVFHNVYVGYLDYCKRNFQGDKLVKEIEKMFYFWQDNDIEPAEFVIVKYARMLKSLGYSTNHAKVLQRNSHGYCSSCNYEFTPTTLSSTDFKILSVSVLKEVVISENIYRGSTPEELCRYQSFIQDIEPYDFVIDGLNVAFVVRTHGRADMRNILQVINLVQTEKKKRILVLGRDHMLNWDKKTMKNIEQQADVFLVKNASQDDPFLLHLTMKSGPDTYFISNDLMRQHKAKLPDPNLRILFKRWQMSRQYYFKRCGVTSRKELIHPLKFQISPQNDENGWHIPYSKSANVFLPDSYGLPDHWICLKTKKTPNS